MKAHGWRGVVMFACLLCGVNAASGHEPQWADVRVTEDSRVVLVDASLGSDANDGLRAPVRTLARGVSLLRDRNPDHLVLDGSFRRQRLGDDSGGWKKSGRSASAPIVIRSAAGQRASILAGGVYPSLMGWAEDGNSPSFVVVSGVDFIADTRDPTSNTFDAQDPSGEAVRFVGSGFEGWTFEDCTFRWYSGAFALDSDNAARPHRDIRITGCRILDMYGGFQRGGTRGHSSGAYFRNVDGLTLAWNVIDHNGWADDVPGLEPKAPRTTYNHGLYVHGSCRNVTIADNIIARSSFAGVQARGGSQDVIGNLLVDNPAHISAGHAQTSWPENGWTGTMAWNVVVGGADLAPDQRRGWGIGASHSLGGTIEHNVVSLNLTAGGGPAISIGAPTQSLIVSNNTVFRWRGDQLDGGNALLLEAPVTGDVIIQENDFQQIRGGLAYIFPADFGGATLIRNRWFTATESTQQIRRFQRSSVALSSIGSIANADEQTLEEVPYPDPGRTPERYAREVLGIEGDWLQAVRSMTRESWDSRLTAPVINAWIRQGYGIVSDTNSQ